MAHLISIVTATYNDAAYLSETLASVLNQSETNWEWIIVNNASSDDTVEILNSCVDPRIQIIHLCKNLGVSGGRNAALEKCNGDYICFLDGDDKLPPDSLKDRLAIFETDDDIEFVDGKVISFTGDDFAEDEAYTPAFRGNPLNELVAISNKVFRGNTWMIKRVAGKAYKFNEEITHGEELLLYMKLSASGKFAFTSNPVLYYRQHPNSAMSNLSGLEKGYRQILEQLGQMTHVSQHQQSIFRLRARRIMFRSFIKNLLPIQAIRSWINFTNA